MSTTETQEYVGKPEEVGGQLLADAIGPTIQSVADSDVTPQQLARMFAGMVAVLAGMIAENFGPDAAADMLKGTAEKLAPEIVEKAGIDPEDLYLGLESISKCFEGSGVCYSDEGENNRHYPTILDAMKFVRAHS